MNKIILIIFLTLFLMSCPDEAYQIAHAQNSWGGTYYNEDGHPEYLTETQDGYMIDEEGDILIPQDEVDLGGDTTYYDTGDGEYEYYYE